ACADDPGAAGGEGLVQVVLVDGGRRAAWAVVRPRAAEDPVGGSPASPSPAPTRSSGPVMYPSNDIVMPAITFVMAICATGSTMVREFPPGSRSLNIGGTGWPQRAISGSTSTPAAFSRSEEHTSELQSQSNLVCRLL